MKKITPKLISSIGLDTRSIKAFDLFFKNHCKSAFSMTDDHKKADLTIADLDAFKSAEKMALFIEDYSERQIIVMSLLQNNNDYKNTHPIKKPVDHKQLADLLKSVSSGKIKSKTKITKSSPATQKPEEKPVAPTAVSATLQTESKWASNAKAAQLLSEDLIDFVGSQPDIDVNKPTEIMSITFDPSKKLLGSIVKACQLSEEKRGMIELSHLGITILVDKVLDTIDCFSGDGIIRPRCLLESEELPVFKRLNPKYREDKDAYKKAHKQSKLYHSDLDTFIWKVALWSSRGRIPQNLNLNTPVYLSEWPNLTRLAAIPHAVRIAALLSQQPQTLSELANNLKIPQRYVFAFYSAANALGISENCKRQVDSLFIQESKTPSYSRSLLGKLLSHLTGNGSAELHKKTDGKNYG